MSYHGHICELPFGLRPMGPCPACEYERNMAEASAPAPAADSRDTEAAQALTADDLRVGLESLLRDLDFHSQYWKWLPSCTTSAYYAKLIRATLAASVPEDHK